MRSFETIVHLDVPILFRITIETHNAQLNRYFQCLRATKVAIVTNGIEYRFFTDLRDQNMMDDEPFFNFNILNYEQKDLDNLKLFHRDNFDAAMIKRHAEDMIYLTGMTQLIENLLRSPSEAFIRFLVSQLKSIAPNYAVEGKITNKVVEKFHLIIKKAIQSSLVNLMTQSISREIGQPSELIATAQTTEIDEIQEEEESELEGSRIETTPEELEAFEKIKGIIAKSKAYKLEIKYKDVVSYFGLNVGKTTWWFLRLYLSAKRKSFVTRLPINEVKALAGSFEVQEMTASLGDATSRVIISSINDLDNLSQLILKCYETEAAKHISK